VPGVIRSNKEEVEMIAMKDERLIYDLVGYNKTSPDKASADAEGTLNVSVLDSLRPDENVDTILHRVIT
jgi:hypothetical protein